MAAVNPAGMIEDMQALTILLKIVLLLAWPSPKNLREVMGIVNTLIAGQSDGPRSFSNQQWEEIRKHRDSKGKRG
jgi:hypothetical protein